jgi:hypothetical protein
VTAAQWEGEEDLPSAARVALTARMARGAVLMQVLSVVLEAKLANELGDVGRSDRAVEVAAERLLELLP